MPGHGGARGRLSASTCWRSAAEIKSRERVCPEICPVADSHPLGPHGVWVRTEPALGDCYLFPVNSLTRLNSQEEIALRRLAGSSASCLPAPAFLQARQRCSSDPHRTTATRRD